MSIYRIRIYTPYFPFPPQSGASQVIYEQARRYSASGIQTELVFWKDSAKEVARKLREPHFKGFEPGLLLTSLLQPDLQRLDAEAWIKKAEWTPEPQEGPRIEEDLKSRVARAAGSLLGSLSSTELYHYPLELDRRSGLQPVSLAIYHYSFAYAWLASQPESMKKLEPTQVVHFHNLESDLASLRARGGPWGEKPIHQLNSVKLFRHERALAGLVPELWFVSPADLSAYEKRVPDASVKLVPPEFDPELKSVRQARYRAAGSPRNTAGFIGALDFKPNQDSLEWIIREVFPTLREQSFSGRFLIAGRGAPDSLREAAERFPFVEWLGFVPDAEEFWSRISVLLSPHVSGSGTRIKLLEAMASGIPVLSNAAGAELLTVDARRSSLLITSEDPKEWAQVVLRKLAHYRVDD